MAMHGLPARTAQEFAGLHVGHRLSALSGRRPQHPEPHAASVLIQVQLEII